MSQQFNLEPALQTNGATESDVKKSSKSYLGMFPNEKVAKK